MLELQDFSEIVNTFKKDPKKDFRVMVREAIEENELYIEDGEVVQDGLEKLEMFEIFLDELDIEGKEEILKETKRLLLEKEYKRIKAYLAYKG